MSGILGKLYRLSPERVVTKAASLLFPKEKKTLQPITVEFLRSSEYGELMRTHLPYDGSYDLHEAQNDTANYRFRHQTSRDRLGVFRWRGMQRNLDLILAEVASPGRRVIDLGGAACPLGLGSVVVDQLAQDAFGRAVPHRALAEIEGPVDVVFSSHCLEHIPDLKQVLREIAEVLKLGGVLLLHLPSFTCDRWHAGRHKNRIYNDHVWTFGLSGTPAPEGVEKFLCIDTVLAEFLTVQKAEFCGDDSLFLVARKES